MQWELLVEEIAPTAHECRGRPSASLVMTMWAGMTWGQGRGASFFRQDLQDEQDWAGRGPAPTYRSSSVISDRGLDSFSELFVTSW